MADRTVENASTEVPEMPDILEKVLLFALNEAKDKAEKGEDVIPFTALVVKEDLFLESHPGESAEECFAFARHTVQGARGADAYALCYDGYIETDDGVKDALMPSASCTWRATRASRSSRRRSTWAAPPTSWWPCALRATTPTTRSTSAIARTGKRPSRKPRPLGFPFVLASHPLRKSAGATGVSQVTRRWSRTPPSRT